MKDPAPLIFGFIAGLLLGIGLIVGGARGKQQIKEEAVLKGHAEWAFDQSGQAVFKWKEIK